MVGGTRQGFSGDLVGSPWGEDSVRMELGLNPCFGDWDLPAHTELDKGGLRGHLGLGSLLSQQGGLWGTQGKAVGVCAPLPSPPCRAGSSL